MYKSSALERSSGRDGAFKQRVAIPFSRMLSPQVLTFSTRRRAMEYFLSGHGGQNTGKMYTLKTRLVTFCPFGQGLDVALSWPLFDALCKGSDISG